MGKIVYIYVYKIYRICLKKQKLKEFLSGGRMWNFHYCLMQENSLFWSAWKSKEQEIKMM